MRKYHGGDVWMAVLDGLWGHRERLIQAFDAQSHVRETAILDDIARKVAEKVEPMITAYADKPICEEDRGSESDYNSKRRWDDEIKCYRFD